jgi:Putative prokaryotic signal transducing protein
MSEPPDFELVLEIHNAGDRAFLRSILDAEGIDYFIQGETVAPYIFNSVPMRLMVRKDQVENARELLENFVQSQAYGGLKRILDKP